MAEVSRSRVATAQSGALRLLRAVAPILVVAALLTVLAFWIDDKRLVLEYLRALAWPAVVGSALWWLREPLRTKLADLLEVSAAGATARFAQQDAANRELEADIADASTFLVGQDEAADVVVPDDTDSSEPPPQTTQGSAPLATSHQPPSPPVPADDAPPAPGGNAEMNASIREAARRSAMEQVIKESAGWGYDMAKIGFSTRPVPVIDWDAKGRPKIQYARGETPEELNRAIPPVRVVTAGSSSRADSVTRLEDEIRKLERERDDVNRSFWNATERIAIEKQIERLRDNLRGIDPGSPYAHG